MNQLIPPVASTLKEKIKGLPSAAYKESKTVDSKWTPPKIKEEEEEIEGI